MVEAQQQSSKPLRGIGHWATRLALILISVISVTEAKQLHTSAHKKEKTPSKTTRDKTKIQEELSGEADPVFPKYFFSKEGKHRIPKKESIDVRFIRASGTAGTKWHVIYELKEFSFAFPAYHGVYPARITTDEGLCLMFLDEKDRKKPYFSDVGAIITASTGRYYFLSVHAVEHLKKSFPMTTQAPFTLPIALFTGNVYSADRQAIGPIFKGQYVHIFYDEQWTRRHEQSYVNNMNQLNIKIYSSDHGYEIKKLKSYTQPRATEEYRVCLFCLENEGVNVDEIEKIQEYFDKHRFNMPSYYFISNNLKQNQEFSIPVENDYYLQFTQNALYNILKAHNEKKLKLDWVKPVSIRNLQRNDVKEPLITYLGKVYKLNKKTAQFYALSTDKHKTEPSIAKYLKLYPTPINESHRLFIGKNDLNRWFKNMKEIPGLFISSIRNDKNKNWPFVFYKPGLVRQKYYLNVFLIKAYNEHDKDKFTTIPYSDELGAFLEGETGNYHFTISDKGLQENNPKPWLKVNYQKKDYYLSPKCLRLLASKDIGVMTSSKAHDPIENNVAVDGKNYTIRMKKLEALLDGTKTVKNQSLKHRTLRHFGQDVFIKADDGSFKSIITPGFFFQGNCVGEMNSKECKGKFTGHMHRCRYKYKDNADKKDHCPMDRYPMTCDGHFSADGCYGKLTLEYRLLYDEIEPVLIESEGENRQLSKMLITEPSRIVGKFSGKYNRTHIEALCEDRLDLTNNLCWRASGIIKREMYVESGPKKAGITIYECSGKFEMDITNCTDGHWFIKTYSKPKYEGFIRPRETKKGLPFQGDLKFILCRNGGNHEKCNYPSKTVATKCNNGYWNGTVCSNKEIRIIYNDNFYIKARACLGTYVDGVNCVGKLLEAYLVGCPYKINISNLCTQRIRVQRKEKFDCDGKTDENGCVGKFRGRFNIQHGLHLSYYSDNYFNLLAPDVKYHELFNITLDENLKHPSESENNWVWIDFTCKSETRFISHGICRIQVGRAISRREKKSIMISVKCSQEFNFNGLSCTNGQASIEKCVTNDRDDNFTLPKCNGTYTNTLCKGNGTLGDECKGGDGHIDRKCIGYWNGFHCDWKKDSIITTFILDNENFISGPCFGENDKGNMCEGRFEGKKLECPKYYMAQGIACDSILKNNISCDGLINAKGCNGTYNGFHIVRGNVLKIHTHKKTLTDLKGYSSGPQTNLTLIDNDIAKMEKRQLAVTEVHLAQTKYPTGDYEFKATCSKFFNASNHSCGGASLNITENTVPEKTYIRVECEGELSIETLKCLSGKFVYKTCYTNSHKGDWGNCNEFYKNVTCKHGGSPFGCPKALPKIYRCFGILENGKYTTIDHCKFNSTKIPFIGYCRGVIENGKCKGIYNTYDKLWVLTTTDKSITDYKKNLTRGVSIIGLKKEIENKNGMTGTRYYCLNEFNHKEQTCDEPIYTKTGPSANSSQPLYNSLNANRCSHNMLNTEQGLPKCLRKDVKYQKMKCNGRYKLVKTPKGVRTFSCLGDLNTFGKNNKIPLLSCSHSYFDGVECLDTMKTRNIPIKFTRMDDEEEVDSKGQVVKALVYKIERFEMVVANAVTFEINNSKIKELHLDAGVIDRTSNETYLKQDLNGSPKIEFTGGKSTNMKFKNFEFDELAFSHLAQDDSAKIIKLQFSKFAIKQCLFSDLKAKNVNIGTLKSKNKQKTTNVDYDLLDFDISIGDIDFQNVQINLPYISNSTVESWFKEPKSTFEHKVVIPKPKKMYLPVFKVELSPNSKKAIISFPEFSISSLTTDRIVLRDYILENKNLVKTNKNDTFKVSKAQFSLIISE